MKNLRLLRMGLLVLFFAIGFIGCDDVTGTNLSSIDLTSLDLSNIDSITINFETNSETTINTIVVNQALINSIDVEQLREVTLDDLSYLLPEKEGYTFENWYFDADLTQALEINNSILDEYLEILSLENLEIEITLYAGWTPITVDTYTVTYHLDGGINHVLNPDTFTVSDQFDLLNPTKEGYRFLSWHLGSLSGDIVTEILLRTEENVDLYAAWEQVEEDETYTITYYLDGGVNNELNPDTYTEGEEFEFLNPTKEGYRFLSWHLGSLSGDLVTVISLETEGDIDLYAAWEQIEEDETYTITYHLDGGYNSAENLPVYKSSDDTIYLLPAFKDDFTFMGWYSDSDFMTSPVTMIPSGSSGNIELWAKWGEVSMLTFAFENGEYTVTGCPEDYVGMVEIPETFNGYPVTKIADNAFAHCGEITEVILSDNIREIGLGAFSYCRSLTSINLDGNIEIIGGSAFEECDALTTITIGDLITTIEAFTFNSCDSLTTVILGENVTTLARQAFAYTALNSITLNDVLVTIDEFAFFNCVDLLDIYIPDTIEYIGQFAFGNCVDLIIYFEGKENTTSWDSNWNAYNNHVVWDYKNTSVTSYNVVYYLDGGVNSPLNPTSITSESAKPLYDPEKEGYIFGGWFLDSGFIVQVTSLMKGITVDVDLYALWIEDSAPTYLTFEEYDDYVAVTGITDIQAEVVVPAMYHGKPVTVIAERAFYNTSGITSVLLPETITTIEKEGFNYCRDLTTINFPESLVSIGDYAFEACSFTSLDLPGTIASYGINVFADNDNLLSVILPDNMLVIREGIFKDCDSLQSINIPESVYEIETLAFSGCIDLVGIDLSHVRVIGRTAFANCQSLTELVLSDELTVINPYAFAYTNSLTSIKLPQNLKIIGEAAFSGCYQLTEINLPESLEVISEGVFWGCKLTSIILPHSLRIIGEHAFRYTDITTIYLPDSLEKIEMLAFRDCEELISIYLPVSIDIVEARVFRDAHYTTKIYINGSQVPDTWESEWKDDFPGQIVYNADFGHATISYDLDDGINSSANLGVVHASHPLVLSQPTKTGYVFRGWYLDAGFIQPVYVLNYSGEESVILYAKWEAKSDNHYNITYYLDGGLNLNEAPYDYDGSEDVALVNPTKVGYKFLGWFTDSNFETAISSIPSNTDGDVELYAKWEEDYLIYQEFEDYVAVIGYKQLMAHVVIPSSYHGKPVTTIGDSAFDFSLVLETVVLPSTITSIGAAAFRCENLKSIDLPEGLQSIGRSAFASAEELTDIIIPSSVVSLGDSVFWGCYKLESVTFNNPLTVIPDSTFEQCKSLTTIIIPEGVTIIEAGAFRGCSSLTSITLPESLITIGNRAFEEVINLTSIVLPSNLESIGEYAFAESGLTSLELPDSLISIGPKICDHCSSLETLTIGQGLATVLDHNDFRGLYNLNAIEVDSENVLYTSIDGVLYIDNDGLTLLRFPSKNTISDFSIPDGVLSISAKAFSRANFNHIYIPDSVTFIGYYAFEYCVNLSEVYLSDQILEIEYDIFYKCNNITAYVGYAEKPEAWDSNWSLAASVVEWGVERDDLED